jgi:CubicO group peptidase (beta-lactamase class C family)
MVVPHLASGYEVDDRTLVNAAFVSWKLPFAAGAVCATATDLLKWEAALDSGHMLSQSSLALMRTPTMLADRTKIDYGFGTRLGSLDGHRLVGHTGSGAGFRNVFESFPDDHLTIVILMNLGDPASPPPGVMVAEIARAALGLTKKNALLDLPVPSTEIAALSGKYDSDEGPVEIFGREGKLYFRIPGRQVERAVRRQAENVYAINENTEARFLISGGRAEWSMVYIGGLLMDAKYRVN